MFFGTPTGSHSPRNRRSDVGNRSTSRTLPKSLSAGYVAGDTSAALELRSHPSRATDFQNLLPLTIVKVVFFV
jgi:hypothetical protein